MLRYISWVAVGMVLAVGVGEMLVRSLEAEVEPPLEWYSVAASQRSDALDRFEDSDRVDLVVVGTSMVNRDMEPAVLGEALGMDGIAIKVALPAAQAPVVERWMTEVVLPVVSPDLVIYGVSSLDFNTNRLEPTIERYDAARQSRPGLLGTIDRWLGRTFATSQHRASLRDLTFVGDATDDVAPREPLDPLTLLQRGLSGTEPPTARELRRETNRMATSVVNDYAIAVDSVETIAFLATLDAVRASGAEVIVVIMPVPTAYIDAHPNGAADYQAFEDFLFEIAADVTVIDMSDAADDEDFADLSHLLRDPALDFTHELAERINSLGS